MSFGSTQNSRVDDAVKWIEDALSEVNTNPATGAGSSRHGQCLPGEFACHTHDQCVPSDRRCDGQRDCFDNSDEANCKSPLVYLQPPASTNGAVPASLDGGQPVLFPHPDLFWSAD